MANKKLYLISPRGFCAGVERAIKIVYASLEKFGAPIYMSHEIVHNKFVVDVLKSKGVIILDAIEEIPENTKQPIILSAHGVSKTVVDKCAELNLFVLNATCPLVTKVHREALLYNKKNYQILLIGHQNHPEVEGTLGQLPQGRIHLLQNKKDIENYEFSPKITYACITQTTLSKHDVENMTALIKKKCSNLILPRKSDICYATTNRQNAVSSMATKLDLVIVVGSSNSSNSKRLVEVAKKEGTQSFLVDNPEELRNFNFENISSIGITAGASAPEILVQSIAKKLSQKYHYHIELEKQEPENMFFPLPSILKQYDKSVKFL